jgi:nitroimidazol reductase NimA-like FMN-containing flavoprotein (pyridoxamine 5'-phosphate oxidase superfamily)
MRKKEYQITDEELINSIIDGVEYGTLALSSLDNEPYSVPLNFAFYNGVFYFHGSLRGKKTSIIKENNKASFSIVKPLSFIPSYFSSDDGMACPATAFFQSVIADGNIEIISDYDEKILGLTKLMQKLQPEGKYMPMDDGVYQKIVNATLVYKLVPKEITAKLKVGQGNSDSKMERIIKYLKERGSDIDMETLRIIKNI